jgi:OmpA-OmpF porin, OOP family
MSFNILDAVKGHFTSELVGKAASFLGESESGVGKAVSSLLPTVLSGITSHASTSEGANAVAEMASSAHSGGILDNIGGFFGDGGSMLSKGAGLISTLFGSKTGGIVDVISNLAGVKSSSTNSILSMVAPIALGALGKHASENKLGASGIASLLSSSSSSWTSLLPSGLSSILGGLGIGGAASAVSGAVSGATSKVTNMASGAGNAVEDVAAAGGGLMKWLLPLLAVAGIGAAIWWFTKDGCGSKPTVVTPVGKDTSKGKTVVTAPVAKFDSVLNIAVYDDGAKMNLDLGGGIKLDSVGVNGFENKLVTFIKSGVIDTVNKKLNWIDLSGVNFTSGTTTYVGKSANQVVNAGKILKANPGAQIKIGGYTDISGVAADNVALSQKRADKVKADMIAAGALPTQIVEAKGYGGEYATAKAGDKPGMAMDRKVAVKVTKQK